MLLRFILEEESLISYVEAQLPEEELEDTIWRELFSRSLYAATARRRKLATLALFVAGKATKSYFRYCPYSLCRKETALRLSTIASVPCILRACAAGMSNIGLRADELERLGDSRFLQELAESQRIKHEIDPIACKLRSHDSQPR